MIAERPLKRGSPGIPKFDLCVAAAREQQLAIVREFDAEHRAGVTFEDAHLGRWSFGPGEGCAVNQRDKTGEQGARDLYSVHRGSGIAAMWLLSTSSAYQ